MVYGTASIVECTILVVSGRTPCCYQHEDTTYHQHLTTHQVVSPPKHTLHLPLCYRKSDIGMILAQGFCYNFSFCMYNHVVAPYLWPYLFLLFIDLYLCNKVILVFVFMSYFQVHWSSFSIFYFIFPSMLTFMFVNVLSFWVLTFVMILAPYDLLLPIYASYGLIYSGPIS